MRSRWVLFVVLLGCGSEERTKQQEPAVAAVSHRDQCIAVRDHVVQLISEYYVAHAPETFDGLDRSDPSIQDGLPPDTTRDTFAAFLATAPGKAWLAKARARTIASVSMSDTVDKCVSSAQKSHLDCWLAATTMEQFQTCPVP